MNATSARNCTPGERLGTGVLAIGTWGTAACHATATPGERLGTGVLAIGTRSPPTP
jgi:hypothetical protein